MTSIQHHIANKLMPNEVLKHYEAFYDKTLALGTQHLASYLTHAWQLTGKALVSKGEKVADADKYVTPKSFNVMDFGIKDGFSIYGIEYPDCGLPHAGKYGVIAYSESSGVRYYTLDLLPGDRYGVTQWKKCGSGVAPRVVDKTDDPGLWGFVYMVRDILSEDIMYLGGF